MNELSAHAQSRKEMDQDCLRLVAKTALGAADSLPASQRIMLHRGIASIFPKESLEHLHAKEAVLLLSAAEKEQLSLFKRLNTTL